MKQQLIESLHYVYASPAFGSTNSHQAPSNIRMANERSDYLVKETCTCLHISSLECVCQRESLLQAKNAFCSLLKMADLKTLALRSSTM